MHYNVKTSSESDNDIYLKLEYLKSEGVSKEMIKSFYLTILGTINSLDFFPERFQKVYKDYRRTLIKKYARNYGIN
ncbi:MAG: hypothetical protein Q9M94_04660 [Candidatus Gracilibacteria bacterium]|nr:hypothetical protein [Candidatus Gracilibacteria bacterium]MDQ7022584.1 hypothetical protein [Candidatus Gracilibacteria bacterium]